MTALPLNPALLFQGDSITDCGRSRDQAIAPNLGLGTGYPHLIACQLLAQHPDKNLKIFNRGISGNRIVDLYARLREDILNLKPDVLSILIGVNDSWHHFNRNTGVPVEKFTRIYRNLLEEIQAELPNIRFILCEPFLLRAENLPEPMYADVDARRAAVRQLATEFKAAFIPFHQVLTDATKLAPPKYWAEDGVHPTPGAHHLMAQSWLKSAPL